MKKDARALIEHVLECVELIEQYTENKTEDDFFDSIQLQDSVIRRIEIIPQNWSDKRSVFEFEIRKAVYEIAALEDDKIHGICINTLYGIYNKNKKGE